MPNNYILRNVDPDVWARCVERAAANNVGISVVIKGLMRAYANGMITPREMRAEAQEARLKFAVHSAQHREHLERRELRSKENVEIFSRWADDGGAVV